MEAGSKTQIPSEGLSSVPSALALLLGTLPLGAWGTRSPSARWFHRRGLEHPSSQAEEAQGAARLCKESVIHEADVLWCPQAGGEEGEHEGNAPGCETPPELCRVQAERDLPPMGVGTLRCSWGTAAGLCGAEDRDRGRRNPKQKVEERYLLAKWKKYKWAEERINFQLARRKS